MKQSIQSDSELKARGATLQVGISQLDNKTPAWIEKITNGIIFLCLAWALFSGLIEEISEETKADINRWMLIISGVIKLGSKFFGYQLPKEADE